MVIFHRFLYVYQSVSDFVGDISPQLQGPHGAHGPQLMEVCHRAAPPTFIAIAIVISFNCHSYTH